MQHPHALGRYMIALAACVLLRLLIVPPITRRLWPAFKDGSPS
jgi:hypothetical protein